MSDRMQPERNLYQKLLELRRTGDDERILSQGITEVSEFLGAERGYIEVWLPEPPRIVWWHSHEMDSQQVRVAKRRISQGIIGGALDEGRFAYVRYGVPQVVEQSGRGIESFVCMPLGSHPVLGAVYLASETPFSEDKFDPLEPGIRELAAAARRLAERENDGGDATAAARRHVPVPSLIGRSAALAEVIQEIGLVASTTMSVLLTGPSGTGKTLIARTIHEHSLRRSRSFVHVNCGGLQDTLIEAELFGVAKGSFTGADETRMGKVEAAEHGTLFLDEIAELTPKGQAALLLFLDTGEFCRLGELNTRKANVRIIAATNANLPNLVHNGAFRADLFHRLHGFEIEIPSLEKRRDDIPLLAEHLTATIASSLQKPGIRLSPLATEALRQRDWPGNIRELENVVGRALVRAYHDGSEIIDLGHLRGPSIGPSGVTYGYREATHQFQRAYVSWALDRMDWNVARTAELLKMSRSGLNNFIITHGLRRPQRGDATRPAPPPWAIYDSDG